jgi:hypothetical protein
MRLMFSKLLKTNVEKMSVFSLSTILMKRNRLKHSLHDIDEKKGEGRSKRGREKREVAGAACLDSSGSR